MTQFIYKDDYDTTVLDGEWIILNTDDYTITKINEVGGHCWSLLKEAQTVETLTESIMDIYQIVDSKEQVKKDIEQLLLNLEECGLIQNVIR
jgi:hypothetical protein